MSTDVFMLVIKAEAHPDALPLLSLERHGTGTSPLRTSLPNGSKHDATTRVNQEHDRIDKSHALPMTCSTSGRDQLENRSRDSQEALTRRTRTMPSDDVESRIAQPLTETDASRSVDIRSIDNRLDVRSFVDNKAVRSSDHDEPSTRQPLTHDDRTRSAMPNVPACKESASSNDDNDYDDLQSVNVLDSASQPTTVKRRTTRHPTFPANSNASAPRRTPRSSMKRVRAKAKTFDRR
jgi:hypothetical protein